jgi:hypothetical protein
MRLVRGLVRPAALAAFCVLSAASCLYQFQGGNFPEHLRTLGVAPVENDTPRLEVTGELQDELTRNLSRALGVQPAGSDVADAVIRVKVTGYTVNAPNYRQGAAGQPAEVLQRQVMITAQAQIVDQVNNQVYWEDTGLRGEGQFLEASESEEVGRLEAIELLVQQIVDGAQSNW